MVQAFCDTLIYFASFHTTFNSHGIMKFMEAREEKYCLIGTLEIIKTINLQIRRSQICWTEKIQGFRVNFCYLCQFSSDIEIVANFVDVNSILWIRGKNNQEYFKH